MSMERTGTSIDELMKRVEKAAKRKLLIGIPARSESRKGETINNAALGYIHEIGAPDCGLPARPFLRPGVAKAKGAISAEMKRAIETEAAGENGRVHLERAGMKAVSSVKKMFADNDWKPITQAAIESRLRRRGKTGEQLKKAAENYPQPAKPLVDTAQLRNSITYIVEEG
ncbi:MAG: hypothetical protein IJ233_11650 [Pyramidobacter sp.]|nr:hypothetical protein [Pyramidobacter sp.]MBQ8130582.1 hypothetical protein [Clostridia bacterium]